jgi:hypothetical protein
MTRHWVVLETGANQDYIFDSNRMRIRWSSDKDLLHLRGHRTTVSCQEHAAHIVHYLRHEPPWRAMEIMPLGLGTDLAVS